MNDTLLALLASGIGGAAMKLAEFFLDKKSKTFDQEHMMRQELRDDLESLREELSQLKKENSGWQSKYWDLLKVNVELDARIVHLTSEIEELKDELRKYNENNNKDQ